MSSSISGRHKGASLDPTRIATARMRRGLTKVGLARLLSVTTRTISTYETDGATAQMGPRLADALGFPVEYFQQKSLGGLTANDVSFRAGSRVAAKAKDAAVASGRNGLEVDAWISERFQLPQENVPRLEGLSPEQTARMLRSEWGLGTKPLPNLVQLLESKGIRVYGLPPSAAAVDAFSFWADTVPFVFSARRRTPEGVRFDLAHELGHLVMHSSKSKTFMMGVEEEREADRFASELLMPESGVLEYLPSHTKVDDILSVKVYFQVSAMALARKSLTAGRLTDWSYRQICSELTRRGYRTSEPGGATVHERSRVFGFVFSRDREQRLTPKIIADDLALPEEDVHALTLKTGLLGIPSSNNGLKGSPDGTGGGNSHSGKRPPLRVI